MPHKHKRKADNDESHFSLPPTELAGPLAVPKSRSGSNPAPKNKKRKITSVDGYGIDDTPKAFARLMQFTQTKKRRSGLDDGEPKKKGKANKPAQPQKPTTAAVAQIEQEATVNSEAQPQAQTQEKLKIQPGESLADFRQRVNQALPLGTVTKTGKKIAGLSDHRVTKHERHLKRLQEGWRKEEARIRDKEQEALELAEEEEDEADLLWEDKTADLPSLHPTSAVNKKGKKNKKNNKRKLVVGEVDDGRGDEWEELKRKREQRKGLHDVVQEPPTFVKVPREIFKVKDGARVKVGNVPNSVGSLRKREELEGERQGIIETYRKLMAAKRDG